ncbi:MAG TPA: hypothetical protein ENG87_05325 [Candidatus Pacearchaeota archaeon]|nr:hypothetical protein BMS3Abin17_00590 [archaeon BMS3Abin17]HDK42778.1 hypothetical protein [Candidatus Pacearchaeota archaeon]HDZ61138.1 hypothetical protein [Candidatus Pacearchaeota archaeon]
MVKRKKKEEIGIGANVRSTASNMASLADGLRAPNRGEKFRKIKIRTKKSVDNYIQDSVFVSSPERKTYLKLLKRMVEDHMQVHNQRTFDIESELIGEDFQEVVNQYGGKYAGLKLLQASMKKLKLSGEDIAWLPTVPVNRRVYDKVEEMAQRLGLVSARKNYLEILAEHKEKFAKGLSNMERFVAKELEDVLKLPFKFNIRTSSTFEYGGPPGFLDSTMAQERRNKTKQEKTRLILNSLLSFYNHKLYERIIPEGVGFSPLIQRALFPDKSAFIFSSLPNADGKGVIIESVLGHAKGIAKGGHSVYTRVHNGSVKEIVDSFSKLQFIFRVDGKDHIEYTIYNALPDMLSGKNYQKEWEEHHQKRLKIWKSVTHKIAGGNSPLSKKDLQFLERMGKSLEDKLGYAVKIEISKVGGIFYPLQLDPVSLSVDKSVDISVPEGAIQFADTPFVNKPFRAEGRLAYGCYDKVGKLGEEIVYNAIWEDGEGVLRMDPDLLVHYCPNVKGVFSASTGAKTCHSAGGLYDFKGFMGSNRGYGPLSYMFQRDKETRIVSTPFKIVLASDGERGVGYIPPSEKR